MLSTILNVAVTPSLLAASGQNITQIPAYNFFITGFQKWVDNSLQPDHSAVQLLERFEQLAPFLNATHSPRFGDKMTNIRNAIFKETMQYSDSLLRDGRKQIDDSSNSDKFSSQQLDTLQTSLADAQTLHAEIKDLEGIDWHIETVLIRYFREGKLSTFAMDEFTKSIRGFLNEIRDDSELAELIIAAPSILASLDIDFNAGERPGANDSTLTHLLPAERKSIWSREITTWPFPVKETAISKVDPAVLLSFWENHSVRAGATWIDLGSGNGATLVNLAARFSQAQFIGIDIANHDSYPLREELEAGGPHLAQKPENVRYIAIGVPLEKVTRKPCDNDFIEHVGVTRRETNRPTNDLMRRKIRQVFRKQSVSYVSMFYPYETKERSENTGFGSDAFSPRSKLFDPLGTQLQSAIWLLQRGGYGFVFTEAPETIDRVKIFLEKNRRRVESITYAEHPLTGDELRAMGIEPYSSLKAEMVTHTGKHKREFTPYGDFKWAFPLVFQLR